MNNTKVSNAEILKNMISTGLHIKYEHELADSHKEILDFANSIKDALLPLFPVTDNEYEEVILNDIASYADCIICAQ